MIIGVTGSLATGKSSVARYLTRYLRGCLIDADRLAHLILGKKGPAYRGIISHFGREILNSKGLIDRARLADKAFNRRSNLKRLCGIIHPIVISDITKRIRRIYSNKGNAFVVVDAPVLIEAGFHKRCDCLVVVTSSLSEQLERARRFKRLNPRDALSRIRFQMPLSEKARYADYIIDNSGDLKELKRKSRELAGKIRLLNGKAQGARHESRPKI